MSPAIRSGLLMVSAGALLGLVVLGIGGRLGMHAVALVTTGRGGFTFGGTVDVLIVGTGIGAAFGLLLFAARALLARWPPLPGLAYWGVAAAWMLLRFDWREPAEMFLVLPLAAVFGGLLQAATWRWRRWGPASPGS
jgi:hypothetical protein